MLEVEGLDHITLAVNNLEEAKQKFETMFGVKPLKEMVLEEHGVKAVFYLVNDVLIGLETPISEGSFKRFLQKKGEGIHHIALSVKDIEKAAQELTAKGIGIIGPHVKEGVRRELFVYPKSFFNVMLQVIQWEGPYRDSLEERVKSNLKG
ncbi:methylmalonyl-CoA epimerase [Caldalkalibacillus uzonensis]|uniref:Methylmalonyl-CoA epimerase n=1 Tax=Caldalkalibacillus uzonensis TaxID=353224 RepID=A0ABU0CWR7_9BACI|nr:VOC family protein [Caldalkalibacillus uzonensis]MDQ0340835.1 methylmalonyl-CoA epimerase [Caldalkalibacillus uzonensis]